MTDTRHDYGPIGLGKNWVTSKGGLPPMIRDVAHALIRHGHSESSAIELAVAAVKRWAAGGDHVKPDTIAKAAAAVAQWEAMKSSTGRSDPCLFIRTLAECGDISEEDAVATTARWALGEGGVKPTTRVRAATAVVEWGAIHA